MTDADALPAQRRKWNFPSTYTILFGVTLLVWLAAFVIPPGRYDTDAEGRPIAGSYHRLDETQSFGERVRDLFLAPINGLYGVQDDKGQVGPDLTGHLYGAAAVFLFVLAVGAFITVAFATGALDTGIGRLAYKLRDRSALLIVGIMAVFATAGTIEGFAEETLGFYALLVPLTLALGYDRMTAVGMIILGAGVGVMCSTVNPFATGTASSAADVPIGNGIVLRVAMLVVCTAVTVAYVLWYARRVKADPNRSLSGWQPGDREVKAEDHEPDPLSRRQALVLWLVGITFAFMIFAVIPWSEVLQGPDAQPYKWELGWYFPELTALFLFGAILIGMVGGLGEGRMSEAIGKGFGDFVGAGFVIVLARGVTVIMNNSEITSTVLHALEGVVTGTSSAGFAVAVYLVNIPLAFLIPSTSGHATLAMPIMAPLADFANVPRSLVVTAWQSASGWANLITPTTAVVTGGIALAKVRYDRYVRFVVPLMGILLVLTCAFVAAGAWLG
ncbi:YfcC family protein [Nocardia huaxiensis]|uniref:YfcC family protein n=1 Tax=Nocardia huaxiensis TaxID=2755382 RepID=A0A7D6V8T0_9NOCA|nr:YfcC family protein [Nocardia huaxiensis]QLY30552.1 YfcC family protein [Nocardia huaxiensis]UFS95846.1 YfcC family protein [Nocardia huaxiensis]